jgi:hypothetical protein
MSGHAEHIYKRLQNAVAIKGLIGECEDAYFDCKEWPGKEDEAQKMLAKAACGLTNAEGGVLVIGMKAKSKSKDEPDIVSETAPVTDTAMVKSKVLNLIGNLVEPGIVGIRAKEINDPKGSKTGFVTVFVPASEGSPRRSKKDSKFYQRIGAGTFPMEYRQIEDMFGKRPHPKLKLKLEKLEVATGIGNPERVFKLGITNVGRGLAKFPSIRFKSSCGLWPDRLGLDRNGNNGLPRRASGKEWVIFRGGIDDVIYPDETLEITLLTQAGSNLGKVGPEIDQGKGYSNNPNQIKWHFDPISFFCEISCEGIPTITADMSFEKEDYLALIV